MLCKHTHTTLERKKMDGGEGTAGTSGIKDDFILHTF